MRKNTVISWIFILVIFAFFLRIYNFSFPAFTTDEARIAFRGYTLYNHGVDELGRKLPFLFNSLNDYQLPLVSYISALGARLPFIVIGLILVLLTYKVAAQFSKEKSFQFFSAFIVATSPVLIFVSKIPNESIVATTLFLLLFYFLNKDRLNLILISLTIILLILTTKFSWFILTPFVLYTVFVYRNTLNMKDKLKLSLISLVFVTLAFIFLLQIPQGARSLSENNFPLLFDVSIKNGINTIRGQGIKSGLPPVLGQILINKSSFLLTGSLHWLSNIQPAVFFSQFSKDGYLGFIGMGAFPKVAIIPALIGLAFLIREKRKKLLLYPVIITFPAAFIYPQFSPQIIILTLPFMSFVIAFGLIQIKRIISRLICIFIVIELLVNFLFLSTQVKMTEETRPYWIKPIVQDAFKMSGTDQVIVSDDIIQDPAPFFEWYAPFNIQEFPLNIPYPYKIRQTNLGRIKLVGFNDSFKNCDVGKRAQLFLTKRDLEKIRFMRVGKVVHQYLNSKGQVIVYYIKEGVCID